MIQLFDSVRKYRKDEYLVTLPKIKSSFYIYALNNLERKFAEILKVSSLLPYNKIQQVLEYCRFIIVYIRCHRNLTLVYINWPVVKLVSLHVVSFKVSERIKDVKRGLTVHKF